MSLVVVVKGPEGIVMAADTRLTLPRQNPSGGSVSVNFDNATKVLTFGGTHPRVGAVTYGLASIQSRTAHSLMPEFELQLERDSYSVAEYASALSRFFMYQWEQSGLAQDSPPGGGMYFTVSGYDQAAPYGDVRSFNIPRSPNPSQQFFQDFGLRWGGQLDVVSRIVHGFDPQLLKAIRDHLKLTEDQTNDLENVLRPRFGYSFPFEALPLQDCIDLAIFLIRTTISAQALAVLERGVGGTIEVATITRTEGFQWVQRKEIFGERRSE